MSTSDRPRPGEDRLVVLTPGDEGYGAWLYQAYLSLRSFLGLPLGLVLAFVVLGIALFALERAMPAWLQGVADVLGRSFFADHEVTGGFLDTIGGGFLTMISIIITMLLLVLQQSAGSMGNLIYDQFLERRRNGLYTGLIVGTLLLALFVRATVSDSFNPIVGATAVLVVAFLSIVALLLFLYSVVEQMRPETIIDDIYASTLAARKRQAAFAARTRREPQSDDLPAVELRSESHGYLVEIEVKRLARCLAGVDPGVEVVLLASPGTFVSYYDRLAEVRAPDLDEARAIAERVGRTFRFANKRETRMDPSYGLEQLEMVAWTDSSSSKQNPEVGLRCVQALRDIMARWALQPTEELSAQRLPVVYSDRVISGPLDVLESLGMVSLESKQHQVMAEVLESVDLLFNNLPADLRKRAEEVVLRLMPYLGQQYLSRELDVALFNVANTIDQAGNEAVAQAIRDARQEQAEPIDLLPSVLEMQKGLVTAGGRPLDHLAQPEGTS